MPRSFALDPSGSYLLSANQLSNNVVVLRIDARTGRLSKTGKEITVETPVCIKFVPALP
jgi:6-phosphogluconolactonase